MIHKLFRPQIEALGVKMVEIWFQQEEATAHKSNASMAVVRERFPQHLILRFGYLLWPACLLDLSIRNFLSWSHLKCKV